jgi:hypothetical protein
MHNSEKVMVQFGPRMRWESSLGLEVALLVS